MSKIKTPTPVKRESRTCFGIAWYATEDDARIAAAEVRRKGRTWVGGFFHGNPCGRYPGLDTIDKQSGKKLFAVTE